MEKSDKTFQPDRVLSYFKKEWKVLLIVTISGLIYNLGLLAGPWFEGKMTGCLVEILRGLGQFSDMLVLVLGYVTAIADTFPTARRSRYPFRLVLTMARASVSVIKASQEQTAAQEEIFL